MFLISHLQNHNIIQCDHLVIKKGFQILVAYGKILLFSHRYKILRRISNSSTFLFQFSLFESVFVKLLLRRF